MNQSNNVDPTLLPAHVLADRISGGKISPIDLLEAVIEKIRVADAKLCAFVETYFDDAKLAAEAAHKAIQSGHALGPFHGIPIALKDLIDVKGRITTAGSHVWRLRRADRSATIAKRLIGAGMIVIGKTHTVEFAFGGWGTNQNMGTPWNPWDSKIHRIPGGSSSGSAVAVSSRMVPWAIGTDTGGSVRLPSSFCGTTGLKSTVGRISLFGIVPLAPTLDTPGPITRNVEDAALLFEILQGADPLDRRTHCCPSFLRYKFRRGVRGLRLARMPDNERTGVSDDVLSSYDRSLHALEDAGAEVETIRLPRGLDHYLHLTSQIMQAEAYAQVGRLVEDRSLSIDESVRTRILQGARISARDYLAALAEREILKEEFNRALGDFDAFLTPTTQTAAIPVCEVDQEAAPSHFTRFVNLLDLCALAVPNGFTPTGLPTSLQIACRSYDEATALRIGWAYQAVTDWHEKIPPPF